MHLTFICVKIQNEFRFFNLLVFRKSKDLYLIITQKLIIHEIRRISCEIHPEPYKFRCFSKNFSLGGFHLKSAGFHEIHWISCGFHEIRRISCEIERPLTRNCNPMFHLLNQSVFLHSYIHRITKDSPRYKDELDTMKFVCKDFWMSMYKKQIDNLRTNHQGVYVLQDNRFKMLTQLSNSKQYLEAAPRVSTCLILIWQNAWATKMFTRFWIWLSKVRDRDCFLWCLAGIQCE